MLTHFTLLVLLPGSIPAAQGLLGKLEVGKLPALGWNSWNAYDCNISEEKFLSAARKLVALGLKVCLKCKDDHTSFPLTFLGCRLSIR
jgi:alpha-galactosidase